MKNLITLLNQTLPVVKATGTFLLNELGKVQQQHIETKALNSLVSYVDKTAEEQLVAGLKPLLPEATFLTEEETIETRKGEWQWIIDPLDGTTNFIHQLPCFSISVALRHFDEVVLGVIYEPSRKECFYATLGGGAFLNEKPIKVSDTTTLSESLLATGFPYYDFNYLPQYLQILEHFMINTRGLRRFGSAAIDMAYTAAGRFDTFFEYGLNAWDIAAGVILVQEAGGKVADFTGGNSFLFGGEMVAGNPAVFEKVLEIIQEKIF